MTATLVSEESKRSENSDEIKQDDNALLVKSYVNDDPLPSVVSVLFYTLILPICIIVVYGHYYLDVFINASSSPDSVPLYPVKSDGNALFKLAVELSIRDRAVSDGDSEVEGILLISERAINVMSHEIKTGNLMNEYKMMTCLLQYRVGLVKYMSNRFLDSVDSYSRVLELGFCEKAQEFNAIESRASSYLVLSQYDKAVYDALFLLENYYYLSLF